jgi:DNA-binding PucR family transcriptional regulator
VGLGTAVGSLGELALSRDQALRAVEVLQRQPSGPQLADIVEVGAPALVMHLVAALEADPSLGAASLRRLRRYDEAKNTQFVVTVAAWLDAFGDTEAAAARLRVHPNTIRYRIRKLRELGLIDLADRANRLALLVHLQREQLT